MNATVNSNGTRVAIANEDGIIRLWDVALGKELASWQLGKAAPDFLLLSPDGGRILAITWRDFVSEKEFWNGVGEGEGTSGEYSPGGRITRYWRKVYRARLWDASTGKEQAILPNESHIGEAAFSPDGLRLAACCDEAIKLLDLGTEQVRVLPVKPIPFGNHVQGYGGRLAATRMWLSFSSDGSLLAATDWTGMATIWKVDSGEEIARYQVGPASPPPERMECSQLALGSHLGAVSYLYRDQRPPNIPVWTPHWLSNLISPPESRMVELVDPISGEGRGKFRLPLGPGLLPGAGPCQIGFLPDGNTLAVYDPGDNSLKLWDVPLRTRLPAVVKWLAIGIAFLSTVSWWLLCWQCKRPATAGCRVS